MFSFSAISQQAETSQQKENTKKVKGEKFANNAFYVEIVGNCIPAAVCYDHIWTKYGFLNISTALGGSYLPVGKSRTAGGFFEVNFLFGKTKNMFEYGIGWYNGYLHYVPKNDEDRHYNILNNTLRLGYRYQKPEGGFLFRAGLVVHSNIIGVTDNLVETAIWNLFIKEHVTITLAGISLGYTF